MISVCRNHYNTWTKLSEILKFAILLNSKFQGKISTHFLYFRKNEKSDLSPLSLSSDLLLNSNKAYLWLHVYLITRADSMQTCN